MKRILTAVASLLICLASWAQNNKIGTSVSIIGGISEASLASIKDAGIEYIEVSINSFWRKQPENEVYIKAYRALKLINEAGLKVWSVHLPFSSKLDISVLDPQQREENLLFFEEVIRLSSIFNPQCLVLHPGSDTIKDESTREERLKCSRNSICRLAIAAKQIGALLCIENLPRTCPGRTAEEIEYLTTDIPNVAVCFDTNHLLLGSHKDFLKKVGDRIRTLHVSDYDGVDEKHWLPMHEKTIIDWTTFYKDLKKTGYKGVFMFEVTKKHGTPNDLVKIYKTLKKF